MLRWCLFGTVLAAFTLVACSDECLGKRACARFPAVTLGVLDARDGGAVSGPSVNGVPCQPFGADCEPLPGDGGYYHAAGIYDLDVTASGYQPSHLVVDVPAATPMGCCGPDYVPQHRDVLLEPL